MIEIKNIKTEAEVERVYPVIRELRTQLSFEDYISLYKQAKLKDEYQLVGAWEDGNCIAIMGYRILYDFVHGKHIYIDDLVVTENRRSEGLGEKLLVYAESRARELGCKGLRLCTGVENERGKKFYERLNWQGRAIAYKKKLGV